MSASAFLTLLLCELALRCFAPVAYRAPRWDQRPYIEQLFRASTVSGLEYELRPEVRYASGFLGPVSVRTNRFGMRGPEVELAKPVGVFRVAAVGDSFTFGHGQEEEASLPHVLQEFMEARLGPGACEVLNFGVTGYSTLEEASVVREKALAFRPDVVLLDYYLNDPELHPDHSLHMAFHRRAWWEYSHLLRYLQGVLRQRAMRRAPTYVHFIHQDDECWPNVVRGFETIRAATRGSGTPVILVVFPDLAEWSWEDYRDWDVHEKVEALGTTCGFRILDLGRRLAARGVAPRALLHADGIHATDEGVRLFAEEIAGFLAGEFPAEPHGDGG